MDTEGRRRRGGGFRGTLIGNLHSGMKLIEPVECLPQHLVGAASAPRVVHYTNNQLGVLALGCRVRMAPGAEALNTHRSLFPQRNRQLVVVLGRVLTVQVLVEGQVQVLTHLALVCAGGLQLVEC